MFLYAKHIYSLKMKKEVVYGIFLILILLGVFIVVKSGPGVTTASVAEIKYIESEPTLGDIDELNSTESHEESPAHQRTCTG